MEEFVALMLVDMDEEKQQKHRQTLLLILTLVGHSTHHDSMRDQILVDPTVPTINELLSHILGLVTPPRLKVVSSHH